MKSLSITTKGVFVFFVILMSCKVLDIKKEVPVNELIVLDNEDGLSMEYFKERYYIGKSQQLLKRNRILDSVTDTFKNNGTSGPIELATLVNYYVKNKDIDYEKVGIENGYPVGTYHAGTYETDDIRQSFKTIEYKNANISGGFTIYNTKDSLLYETHFKNGTGYWKDFYLNESKLREEGQVKMNYKYGIWKYYDLFGKIDSTKTYTLQDSIDVRYPYCLFN